MRFLGLIYPGTMLSDGFVARSIAGNRPLLPRRLIKYFYYCFLLLLDDQLRPFEKLVAVFAFLIKKVLSIAIALVTMLD